MAEKRMQYFFMASAFDNIEGGGGRIHLAILSMVTDPYTPLLLGKEYYPFGGRDTVTKSMTSITTM